MVAEARARTRLVRIFEEKVAATLEVAADLRTTIKRLTIPFRLRRQVGT